MVSVGLLLAAGEGSRLGQPKALVRGIDGETWLARSVGALRNGNAEPVYIVVGAEADSVRAAAPSGCRVVEADDWREGMGVSLQVGLGLIAREQPHEAADAVLIMLVDTPQVGPDVVRRFTAMATPESLARATYEGVPAHPVLVGRHHWAAVVASAEGDTGARRYLDRATTQLVECSDIGSGDDIDTAEALSSWRRRSGAA